MYYSWAPILIDARKSLNMTTKDNDHFLFKIVFSDKLVQFKNFILPLRLFLSLHSLTHSKMATEWREKLMNPLGADVSTSSGHFVTRQESADRSCMGLAILHGEFHGPWTQRSL